MSLLGMMMVFLMIMTTTTTMERELANTCTNNLAKTVSSSHSHQMVIVPCGKDDDGEPIVGDDNLSVAFLVLVLLEGDSSNCFDKDSVVNSTVSLFLPSPCPFDMVVEKRDEDDDEGDDFDSPKLPDVNIARGVVSVAVRVEHEDCTSDTE
eukprot:4732178-Ditylum_brightwellii.AAC.1